MEGVLDLATQAALALPDDVHHHAVLADRFLELGDPRGEFIALSLIVADSLGSFTTDHLQRWRQLKLGIEPDAARRLARLNQLRLRHSKSWLGALASVAKYVEYHLGLLDSIGLQNTGAATPREWAAAAKAPELGTVRTFLKGKGTPTQMVAFLAGGQLRALRTLEVPHRLVMKQLERQPITTLRKAVLTCPLNTAAGLGRVAGTLRSLEVRSGETVEDLIDFLASERPPSRRWELSSSDALESVSALEPLLEHIDRLQMGDVTLRRLNHGWALEDTGLDEGAVENLLDELPQWVTEVTVKIFDQDDFREPLERLHRRGVRVSVFHRLGTYGLGNQTVDFEPRQR